MNQESPPALPVSCGTNDSSSSPGRLSWPNVWIGIVSFAAIAVAIIQIARGHFGADLYLPTVCFVVCLLGAGYDAATGRIPNALTYTAIIAGIIAHLLMSMLGWAGLHVALGDAGTASPILDSLAGFALCAVIGLLCQAVARMGGGDMKLLAAAGALLGWHAVGPMLLCALVVALPYALLNLILFGGLNAVTRIVSLQLLALIWLREIPPSEPVSKRTIPLGVPLLLGLLVSQLFPVNQWLWST